MKEAADLLKKLDFVTDVSFSPSQTRVAVTLMDGSVFNLSLSSGRSGRAVVHDDGAVLSSSPELLGMLHEHDTLRKRLLEAALGAAEIRGGMICITVPGTPQGVLMGVVRYWQLLHDLMDLKRLAAAAA
ncbi:MAG: hypothetical protein QW650_01220 [Thermofilum sp.]